VLLPFPSFPSPLLLALHYHEIPRRQPQNCYICRSLVRSRWPWLCPPLVVDPQNEPPFFLLL
jgi:hypothetical protein